MSKFLLYLHLIFSYWIILKSLLFKLLKIKNVYIDHKSSKYLSKRLIYTIRFTFINFLLIKNRKKENKKLRIIL